MTGGPGHDQYMVDNVATRVVENAASGWDIVSSSVSYSIGANVEELRLTGTAAINGTGNSEVNVLIGNSANNVLTGGAGGDFLYGLAGTDTLIGDSGNDLLRGGAGVDTMTGGTDADTFDFDAVSEIGTAVGARDIITDFLAGADRLDFSTLDANTAVAGDQDFAFIGTAAFSAAGQLRYEVVGGNTLVQGNVTGTTGAEFVLQLNGVHTITAAELIGITAAPPPPPPPPPPNVINGTAGADTLIGTAGVDTINGLGGNDTIDGGLGADTMAGGPGHDRYVVDNIGRHA